MFCRCSNWGPVPSDAARMLSGFADVNLRNGTCSLTTGSSFLHCRLAAPPALAARCHRLFRTTTPTRTGAAPPELFARAQPFCESYVPPHAVRPLRFSASGRFEQWIQRGHRCSSARVFPRFASDFQRRLLANPYNAGNELRDCKWFVFSPEICTQFRQTPLPMLGCPPYCVQGMWRAVCAARAMHSTLSRSQRTATLIALIAPGVPARQVHHNATTVSAVVS